jgi:hypothetical protein
MSSFVSIIQVVQAKTRLYNGNLASFEISFLRDWAAKLQSQAVDIHHQLHSVNSSERMMNQLSHQIHLFTYATYPLNMTLDRFILGAERSELYAFFWFIYASWLNWKWEYCIQDYLMRILFYVMMLNLHAIVLHVLGQMACIRVSSSRILFVNPLYHRFPIGHPAYYMQIAKVLFKR